jgi:fatty-acid desaturase
MTGNPTWSGPVSSAAATKRFGFNELLDAGLNLHIAMHWFVGYICHTHGPQSWLVNNGAVQAHNVPWAAIPSMGESWHNNHHAFPASARHGLYPGQLDIGFHVIR